MPRRAKDKPPTVFHYFRVAVTYKDGEVSAHRVFKDEANAKTFAKRLRRSTLVKSTKIVPFVIEPFRRKRAIESAKNS